MRVGLLEDEQDHAAATMRILQEAGHSCEVYAQGERFLRAILHETYDVLVLDWALPDMTGLQVIEAIRQRQDTIPVLFLTSYDTEEDIVRALGKGADDYLVKPPRKAELLARLTALKRRVDQREATAVLSVPPYVLDPVNSSLQLQGQPVELTLRQFQLALVLFRNIGKLLSRAYLLEAVWGLSTKIQTRTLDIHISQLRSALDLPAHGWRITSVYAHGYRLEPLTS
ncbi:response regulator transcription factor [Rhodoferax saidenbachensis]|uniref:DNA-binding response OmpR family regulator n=1 Tax=Rhodoferax saidenbachensis TaxID=1484693 RepID=A0ABU1ZPL1_9BURK|nr:response regulator transcription factor [Rhodoferax saidenbachensis]MDR7307504.1 DNA-binding response OmpR family regulator [Rhodoferax saidenbachensis]